MTPNMIHFTGDMIQASGNNDPPLGTACVRGDDDRFGPIRDVFTDVLDHRWLGKEVVNGRVEEALKMGSEKRILC